MILKNEQKKSGDRLCVHNRSDSKQLDLFERISVPLLAIIGKQCELGVNVNLSMGYCK